MNRVREVFVPSSEHFAAGPNTLSNPAIAMADKPWNGCTSPAKGCRVQLFRKIFALPAEKIFLPFSSFSG
jgi:hypothetical protein